MKCLEKDRARRYDTSNALAMDLKRHLKDETVSACPPTTAYRLRKAFRRNRLIFSTAAAVTAALLIGIGVSTRQTFVARKAQRETETARRGEETQRREAQQKQIEAEAARRAENAARKAAEYANYISKVGLAAINLDLGNSRTAQEVLLAASPEYRNWEWSHLVEKAWPSEIALANRNIKTIPPFSSVAEYWRGATPRVIVNLAIQNSRRVNATALQKNGRQILTSPNNGEIQVWDGRTGKRIKVINVNEGLLLALSLNQEETLIAAGHTRGGISLLDAETGVKRWVYRSPTRKPVDSVWFSPDGHYLLAGYFGSNIDVLDVKTGGKITLFDGHAKVTRFTERSKELTSLQFLEESNNIISASTDGSVRIWNPESGSEIAPTQFARDIGNKGISIQTINPANSREVATGGHDGIVYIWDRITGQKTHSLGQGLGEISHLLFSRDGSCLFVVEKDQMIRVLDRSGHELASFRSAHEFFIVELNQDNGRILTTSRSGRSRIWAPVQMDRSPSTPLGRAHSDAVIQAKFSRDGNQFVTASFDTTVKVWNRSSQRLISTFQGHTNEVFKADFSPDRRTVASVSILGEYRISDTVSGRELFHQASISDRFFKSIVGLRNGMRGIFLEYTAGFSPSPFSPSSPTSKLVVPSNRGMIVRHGLDGEELFSLPGSANVGWPVISPTGKLVAVMTDESDVIRVWDLNSGELKYTLTGHQGKTFWAAFSNDSKRIVTGSMDGTAIIWDADTGNQLVTLRGQNGFVSIARFDPDGNRIVTAANDTKSIVWNTMNGEILSTLTGPEQRITNVEFNPDPDIDRVMTTAADNTVRVWDPSGPDAHELLLITREARLTCATWSPDGRAILTGWGDGVVQLYETVPIDDLAQVTNPSEMASKIQQWRMSRHD